MSITPKTAFILAAGRGKRMAHLTDDCPKPLIQVKGKALIDYVVEKVKSLGIKTCFVNLYYQGEKIEKHLKETYPEMDFRFVWDWCAGLETGGGIEQVIDKIRPLAPDGFLVFNSDTIWTDSNPSVLSKMLDEFDPKTTDIMLLFEPKENVLPAEDGNYFIENGKPRRQKPGEKDIPYLYAGTQIVHPRAFDGAPHAPFTIRDLFDKSEKSGRLGYIIHNGYFFHVGTPEGLEIANNSKHIQGSSDWQF